MATVRESPEALAKLASEMADDILALIRKHKLNSDTLPMLSIFWKSRWLYKPFVEKNGWMALLPC